MEIVSTQCYASGNAIRVVDTGNDMIINTVPYSKETNSPMPFNNISLIKGYETCIGKNAMHPVIYNNSSTAASEGYNAITDKKAINMIVDNQNPNICYCVPTHFKYSSTALDETYEENATRNWCIYKLEKIKNNTIIKTVNKDISYYSSTTGNNAVCHCNYMTQNNTHIFVVIKEPRANSSSYYSSHFYCIYKIDKETLNMVQRCFVNSYGIYRASTGDTYLDYISGKTHNSSSYNAGYYSTKLVLKVLRETNDGLYIYFHSIMNADSSPSSSETQYYNGRLMFYSFNTGLLTHIETDKEYALSPTGLPTHDSSSSWSVTANACHVNYAIPSKFLESETNYYGYLFSSKNAYGSNIYPDTMFIIQSPKDNTFSMTVDIVSLIFPEDLGITSIPYRSSYIGSTGWPHGETADFYGHETYLTNTNGIDYIHIFYKGQVESPLSTRGIYTFKVNEEKTEATLTSFYPALGGSLIEFMPITDDGEKIVLATATSYHILKFDLVSESWVSTYDSMTKIKSMIQTDENKLYYIAGDDSIHCQDLNGAVTIDFNFEKQVYNYNNADIQSYIQIWALDSEGNYCATNIKLTLMGNVIWQANGLQTLETSTSAEGPINIPFVIKGHTSINVGVDAII